MQKYSGNPIFKRALSIPKNVFEGSLSRGSEGQKAMKLLDLEATAYTFAEFRQWGRCLENIQEINKLSPIKDVELLLLQSNALEYLNRREEAYSILRQCQRLNPSHATIQNNLGYHMLEFGGDIQDASQLIKAALDQEPNNSSYMDSWGWALFKQGMFKEAEEVLQRAVEANPFSPETRKHLGETLIKLNRPQEALEQWERALAFIFPDRIKVEEWVKNLRTELAKKALEESEPEEISSDEDEDGYDDGW
jgi:Flp pilus assembly protein TadD